MSIDITKLPVSELMPHKPPMLLIDRIIDWGDEYLTAEVCIDSNSMFLDENNNVPAWVGIEYMAQTVAAFAGVRAYNEGAPIPVGFLLGTRKYLSKVDHFKNGEKLVVKIQSVYEDEAGLGSFDCEICTDNVLASARINTFKPKNDKLQDFLESSNQ
ncbi:MAG: hotdog family protein [Gammaproteobacteria bacterium]|nr:hotdog family protein [Gammaproteobacteria bacterium]MDH5592809.1 hotdog family protein [Gammaproteobacteria bacterium]